MTEIEVGDYEVTIEYGNVYVKQGNFWVGLPLEAAWAIHTALGQTEPCSDCSCFEAGYEHAQEHVGEWNRPY